MEEKININQVVDSVNKKKHLTKEERFEKIIDVVYSRLWNTVKEEEWKVENNKTLILATIAENKLKNSIYSRVKHTARKFLF